MNAVATRPEWLALVEQCEAAFGATVDLPSLEDVFGAGRWKIERNQARADGSVWHCLYWALGTKATGYSYHRVGTFYLDKTQVQTTGRVNRDQCGGLTIGYDDLGRRLVKVKIDKKLTNAPENFNVVAVVFELYRGVLLPRPVPVFGVEVTR